MGEKTTRAKSTQQAYDRVAADFAARTAGRSSMAAEFFDQFLDHLEAGSVVADLGCGPGHDLRRLLDAGHRPIGIDRSHGLLGQCPSDVSQIKGDLRVLGLAAASVDGIWSSAALLHVDRVDLAATFAEWDRVLRPGGAVAIATSLGGDEGWEVVPAAPARVPEIAVGDQRWFVHHEQDHVLTALTDAGLSVSKVSIRESHRQWLQVTAVKPLADANPTGRP